MFCEKCGKVIPENSKFCSYCGETIKSKQSEQPAGKGYGFCAKCGVTLPDGKLEGLCDDCLKMQEPASSSYPFGSCGRCAKPLEEDDKNGVCKNCLLDLQYEEKQASGETPVQSGNFYTPGKIRPVEVPKQKHGCLTAVLVCVGLLAVIAIIGSMQQPTPTAGNVATSSATESVAAPAAKSVSASSAVILKVGDDVKELHSKALDYALTYAEKCLTQYGNTSPGGNHGQIIEDGIYALQYELRAPNVYGTNEKHTIYVLYKKSGLSDWALMSVIIDDAYAYNAESK